MAFGGIVRRVSRGIGRVGSNLSRAAGTTLSNKIYANPSAVLGAWGDVGQSATAGAMEGVRAVPGGAATDEWIQDHQRELWQAGAIAATAGGASGAAAAGASPWAVGGGVAAAGGALAIEGAYKSERDAARRAERAMTQAPDINEKNDPELAAQFKRIRRGARMLGRAGTIKYKGAANLGLGDEGLGDPLALSAG